MVRPIIYLLITILILVIIVIKLQYYFKTVEEFSKYGYTCNLCDGCDPGTHRVNCSGTNEGSCTPCTGQTYKSDNGNGECTGVPTNSKPTSNRQDFTCDPGYFKSGNKCYTIPTGYFVDSNDYTSTAVCPIGHKCIGGVKIKCPSGKYQNETGQTDCKPCTQSFGAGKYIETPCTQYADAKPGNCPGGRYCDGVNRHLCSSCGPGQYVSSPCTSTRRTQCSDNVCHCSIPIFGGNISIGQGTTGRECTTHGENICKSCNHGYNLWGTSCVVNGFRIYQNSNHSGSSEWHDNDDSSLGWWHNRTSGFTKQVGASVGIHDDTGYGGWCTDLTQYGEKDFTDNNYDQSSSSWDWGYWNDRISSISIPNKCGNAGTRPFTPTNGS